MTWTRNPLFGVFLLVGFLGMSVLLATGAQADDVDQTTTVAPASDGSPDSPATDEAEKEEEGPFPVADATPAESFTYTINTLIMFISAVLVIFMQAGFAMVEVGLNSAKNTVNILFKNVMDLSVGVILFLVIGFGLMYPGAKYEGKWFGFGSSFVARDVTTEEINGEETQVWGKSDYSSSADFLFQVAFAATAATIVSGAVAGRMKFEAYLIYSAVITGLIYPISGMWKWGGGALAVWGFQDFAGSVLVHAVGGFAGLAGAILLGARLGRFTKDGKSIPIPGHNIAFAALGVFILWVGWYGFNPGSQLKYAGIANAENTTYIAVTTTLSAAIGAFVAMLTAWILFKKPDVTMALNGALAGLVGITANCDQVSEVNALIIGGVAGILVVAGILLLDKLRIDDPVGAFPVHGICGVWGGIATGIFGFNIPETIWGQEGTRGLYIAVQCASTLVVCAWAFGTMFVLFSILKAAGILRVSAEDEEIGLDVSEHGMSAYPPSLVADYRPSTASSAPAAAKA